MGMNCGVPLRRGFFFFTKYSRPFDSAGWYSTNRIENSIFSFPAAASQLDWIESAAFNVWLGAPEDGRADCRAESERRIFDCRVGAPWANTGKRDLVVSVSTSTARFLK